MAGSSACVAQSLTAHYTEAQHGLHAVKAAPCTQCTWQSELVEAGRPSTQQTGNCFCCPAASKLITRSLWYVALWTW